MHRRENFLCDECNKNGVFAVLHRTNHTQKFTPTSDSMGFWSTIRTQTHTRANTHTKHSHTQTNDHLLEKINLLFFNWIFFLIPNIENFVVTRNTVSRHTNDLVLLCSCFWSYDYCCTATYEIASMLDTSTRMRQEFYFGWCCCCCCASPLKRTLSMHHSFQFIVLMAISD